MIAAAESSAGDEAAAAIREAEEASAKKIQAMERGRQKRAELKAKADAQVRLTFPAIIVMFVNFPSTPRTFPQVLLNFPSILRTFAHVLCQFSLEFPQRRAMNERLDAADAKLANVSF